MAFSGKIGLLPGDDFFVAGLQGAVALCHTMQQPTGFPQVLSQVGLILRVAALLEQSDIFLAEAELGDVPLVAEYVDVTVSHNRPGVRLNITRWFFLLIIPTGMRI